MNINDLTDKAFFDLYQKNPQIKQIVDSTQKKYHAHFSQKGQPDYNEANVPIAMKEAKSKITELLVEQKPKEKTQDSANAAAPSGKMQYAAGLATVLIAVALASAGMPYVPPLY